MTTPGTEFDWRAVQYGTTVLCELKMRPTYQGRSVKEQLLGKDGMRFMLEVLWEMDSNDPYPGEFALSTTETCRYLFDTLGITWIASGDVVVVEESINSIAERVANSADSVNN